MRHGQHSKDRSNASEKAPYPAGGDPRPTALPGLASASARPTPGAAGIGDPLFPTLGNGGYDVKHYDLDLRYATPTRRRPSTARRRSSRARRSRCRASTSTSPASRSAASPSTACRATFARDGDELVITPRAPVIKGRPFVVRVAHYVSHPSEPNPDELLSTAFFITPDGSATAGQPDSAHVFMPSNDHPRDKASFTIRFDVPAGRTALANGVQVAQVDAQRPHALRLPAAPADGHRARAARRGRLPEDRARRPRRRDRARRDRAAPGGAAGGQAARRSSTHLDWMQARVGDYPFDAYGSLVVDVELGFALETQTLSLYDRPWFDGTYGGRGVWEPTMVHELSHMWFGDCVSPYEWSDLWLNEGHATWYEWTFAAEHGVLEEDIGIADFEELMQVLYSLGDRYRAAYGPVAAPLSGDVEDLFSRQAYFGGALVLYALRQQVGEDAFARIERAWVSRYRDGVASTADFIALASRVSGQDLTDVPARVALRHRDAAHAGAPGLDGAEPAATNRIAAAAPSGLLARAKR